jgi:hypothetical protein
MLEGDRARGQPDHVGGAAEIAPIAAEREGAEVLAGAIVAHDRHAGAGYDGDAVARIRAGAQRHIGVVHQHMPAGHAQLPQHRQQARLVARPVHPGQAIAGRAHVGMA